MKKSDVGIRIVPTDNYTRFFIKNEEFEDLPGFEISHWRESPDDAALIGDTEFTNFTYDQAICLAALFEAVADWIKPQAPKKDLVQRYQQAGWLSPDGEYYTMTRGMMHQEIDERIWADNYDGDDQSTESWATVQTDLLRKGWLRFDFGDVMFMRRPTAAQKEIMEQMLAWKLRNPVAYTIFDLSAYEKMQRICLWLSEDAISVAVSDFADLEEEIEKR